MKKLVLALFAVSTPLMFVQAQSSTTTGTYKGFNEPKCIITTNLAGNNNVTPVNDFGADQFADTFRGGDRFSYQSNSKCTYSFEGAQVEGPEQVNIKNCRFAPGDVLGSDGKMVMAQSVKNVDTTFEFADSSGVLEAGNYTFTCTLNIAGSL